MMYNLAPHSSVRFADLLRPSSRFRVSFLAPPPLRRTVCQRCCWCRALALRSSRSRTVEASGPRITTSCGSGWRSRGCRTSRRFRFTSNNDTCRVDLRCLYLSISGLCLLRRACAPGRPRWNPQYLDGPCIYIDSAMHGVYQAGFRRRNIDTHVGCFSSLIGLFRKRCTAFLSRRPRSAQQPMLFMSLWA